MSSRKVVNDGYPERKNAAAGRICGSIPGIFELTAEDEERIRNLKYEDCEPIEDLIARLQEAEKNCEPRENFIKRLLEAEKKKE